MEMTKELATKIMTLHIEENRISNEKYHIQKDMGLTWNEVCAEAMKFMMAQAKNS